MAALRGPLGALRVPLELQLLLLLLVQLSLSHLLLLQLNQQPIRLVM